jgi:hypothetical protein
METIKRYFSAWDLSRIIRIVLGIAMGIGYLSTKENIYLVGAIVFTLQAVLNMGCFGGACSTNLPEPKDKPAMKIDKYEPKNNSNV